MAKKSGSQKKIEILKNHHSSDSQTAWRIPSDSGNGPAGPEPKKIRKISTFFQIGVKFLFEVPVSRCTTHSREYQFGLEGLALAALFHSYYGKLTIL